MELLFAVSHSLCEQSLYYKLRLTNTILRYVSHTGAIYKHSKLYGIIFSGIASLTGSCVLLPLLVYRLAGGKESYDTNAGVTWT